MLETIEQGGRRLFRALGQKVIKGELTLGSLLDSPAFSGVVVAEDVDRLEPLQRSSCGRECAVPSVAETLIDSDGPEEMKVPLANFE